MHRIIRFLLKFYFENSFDLDFAGLSGQLDEFRLDTCLILFSVFFDCSLFVNIEISWYATEWLLISFWLFKLLRTGLILMLKFVFLSIRRASPEAWRELVFGFCKKFKCDAYPSRNIWNKNIFKKNIEMKYIFFQLLYIQFSKASYNC